MSEDNDVPVPQPQPAASSIAAHSAPVAFMAAVKAFLYKAKKDGKEIAMSDVVVPKSYFLTLDDHSRIVVPAGFQTMPKAWADHWFSRANGVSPGGVEEEKPVKLTAAQKKAAQLEEAMGDLADGKVSEVVEQLPALSLDELNALLNLETNGRNRPTLVTAIAAQLAKLAE